MRRAVGAFVCRVACRAVGAIGKHVCRKLCIVEDDRVVVHADAAGHSIQPDIIAVQHAVQNVEAAFATSDSSMLRAEIKLWMVRKVLLMACPARLPGRRWSARDDDVPEAQVVVCCLNVYTGGRDVWHDHAIEEQLLTGQEPDALDAVIGVVETGAGDDEIA